MSMFYCEVCDRHRDSDYIECDDLDGELVCSDCAYQVKAIAKAQAYQAKAEEKAEALEAKHLYETEKEGIKMTAAQQMIKALNNGERIGTDNKTCIRFKTNDMRDVARKVDNLLHKQGKALKRDYKAVTKPNGTVTRVAVYSL